MTWQGNQRTTTPEWRALRLRILQRDGYRCHVCGQPGADQVDHLRSHAECTRLGINPDHDSNLAAIHDRPCHRTKSAREGNTERARRAAQRKRPTVKHPGSKVD